MDDDMAIFMRWWDKSVKGSWWVMSAQGQPRSVQDYKGVGHLVLRSFLPSSETAYLAQSSYIDWML